MINKFMRKLRLGVTGFVILIIISAFASIFGLTGDTLGFMEIIGMIVIILIMSMLLYVIIYYWYGKDHKCLSCNKRFCLKKGKILWDERMFQYSLKLIQEIEMAK